eukprot:TRINITY_DN10026_c0_g4_i1.p1 TRINITY_DN10026_c0_g4~~TRINITY_DN10026_c0_g4_i1.p1  ORF type:complete len:297 (-),score=50.59 TRINITY_DN10026_c0_g4_i1:155-1045(-)
MNLGNPIISPCKCRGSMKFIHLECLKPWIKQRIMVSESFDSTVITWKSMNCELCKTPYPFAVYFDGKVFELIDCKVPKCPYIVFEHNSKGAGDTDSLFIVSFSERNKFKIGRHHDNEIRLNDMSVSRRQAVLSLGNDGIYLEDTGSKFGTLILMQRPHTLQPKEVFRVQCERTLMEFSVERAWSLFSYFTRNSTQALSPASLYLPEKCLPGNGKHQLLVVRKATYSRFLRDEERLRAKTPISRWKSGVYNVHGKLNGSAGEVLQHQKTVSHLFVPSAAAKPSPNTCLLYTSPSPRD